MPATTTQLETVLYAAERVLLARQDEALSVKEWLALARAVAVCTGRRPDDLLSERDLEEIDGYPPLPPDEAANGALRSRRRGPSNDALREGDQA